MRSNQCNGPTVGEDITVPASVARDGKIRIKTNEAAQVARWFGLGARAKAPRRRKRAAAALENLDIDFAMAAGTITLITGPSGAGKSSLLRRLREHSDGSRRWIDLADMRFEDVPIVNCFDDRPLVETLKLLGRVGLGEAWSYLRTPVELSEGQRFRLKLAMGMHRATKQVQEKQPILVCDEFCATLDRLTAMIVSRSLRRTIDAHRDIAAVVATSHDDLTEALKPDVVVRCDFGRDEILGQTGGVISK